jgi:NADH:ubiquinone oxidoreductase subunit 6 (subunit J)
VEVASVNTKRALVALLACLALFFVILGTILTVTWQGELNQIPTNVVGIAVFHTWGPTLILVGVLMFASMLGGVFIAQEDRE